MGAYLIFSDFTDSSTLTVSNSTVPQVAKTWTLDQSDAFNIRVEAVFRIVQGGSSTAQTINPTITIGSNTRTFAFATVGTSAVGDNYLTAVFAAESRNGDTVTAQLNGSAGTDANTSVTVKSFEIIEYCP